MKNENILKITALMKNTLPRTARVKTTFSKKVLFLLSIMPNSGG